MSKRHNSYRGHVYYTPNKKIKIEDVPSTPVEDEGFGKHNHLDFDYRDNDYRSSGTLRRSMSMSAINFLRAGMKMEYERDGSCHSRQRLESGHPDVPIRGPDLEYSKTKFVSMAEAIYHFQRDTPNRFHTTQPQRFRSSGTTGRMPLTVPQSPMLRSKARSRPLHVLSQKEKEELELEEIRKHKIKAQPIPKSVIEGTRNLPDVPRKPLTVPEPFNLTEMHKKLMESPELVSNFKARPVPKHILEKPFVPVKPLLALTESMSPKFHYKKPNADKNKQNHIQEKQAVKVDKPIRKGPVCPEPFSFEKRDEEMKKRKEEKIKKQIEEEKKKASLFKAQPLTGAVKKHMTVAGSSSTNSENKENHIKFEAKPATDLCKEPFKPVLQLHFVEPAPAPFKLTSEKRAAEQERFDMQLKEEEDLQERMRQQREEEQRLLEEKAQAELKAKLGYQTAPTNKVFIPEKSSHPLTVPETQNLSDV